MGAKPPRGSRLLARRVQRGLPERTGLTELKDLKASRAPLVQMALKDLKAFKAPLVQMGRKDLPVRPPSPLTRAIPPRSGLTT